MKMLLISFLMGLMSTSCSQLDRKVASANGDKIFDVLLEGNNCEVVVSKDDSGNYLGIKKFDQNNKDRYELFWLAPLTPDYKIDTNTEMFKSYIKKDRNTFRNSYYKVGNNRGVHEFSFENIDDLKSFKNFKAIQSSGFGENAMFPVFNFSKKTIAECSF